MIFTNINTSISRDVPPAPIVYQGIGFFIVTLDVINWVFPTYVNWIIEYSNTKNELGDYINWIYAAVATDTHYSYFHVNPLLTYGFRYTLNTKAGKSLPSPQTDAGTVKVGVFDPDSGGWVVGEAT